MSSSTKLTPSSSATSSKVNSGLSPAFSDIPSFLEQGDSVELQLTVSDLDERLDDSRQIAIDFSTLAANTDVISREVHGWHSTPYNDPTVPRRRFYEEGGLKKRNAGKLAYNSGEGHLDFNIHDLTPGLALSPPSSQVAIRMNDTVKSFDSFGNSKQEKPESLALQQLFILLFFVVFGAVIYFIIKSNN